MHHPSKDRGAAAVEFALVLPILMLIICGIIDFGRAYNAQITLTNAAREAVRVWALGGTAGETSSRAVETAVGLTGVTVTGTSTTAPCTFGAMTTVTVTADFTYVFPLIKQFAPSASTITTRGVMRCGG